MGERPPDVDTSALEAYLAAELDVAVTETEVLGDGLNRVVAVSTPDADRAYVVRRPNDARGEICPNDVRAEYHILERLAPTAVPAPTPVLLCEDGSVFGGPFLVATYLDGDIVPLGESLPARFQTADARRAVAVALVDALADIHAVDTAPFQGICTRFTPREQVDRTAALLDDATAGVDYEPAGLRGVADWLRANAPEDHATTLLHGDYRPGNVLLVGDDCPGVGGVLDWETAMLGDPLIDLGYLLLRWRDPGDPTPDIDAIAARYPDRADAIDDLRETNARGLAPFTARDGSPNREAVVERYESRTDRTFENERFHLAYAAFMLATVWTDLHCRQVAAGAASGGAPHAEYLGLLAELVIDGELRV
ncbi:MAG: phosphotransferase family protein [Haloglomus sp.]